METLASESRLVWFFLVGEDGKPYKGESAQTVAMLDSNYCDVQAFCTAIIKKYICQSSFRLKDNCLFRLRVYINRTVFDNRKKENQEPLEEDAMINNFGKTEQDSLIVLIPEDKTIEYKHVFSTIYHYQTIKRQRIESESQSIQRQFNVCLQIADSLNLDMIGQLIKVPQVLLGVEFPYGLYIREEYKTLQKIITKVLTCKSSISKVLILGSPGIGKSTFGVLMCLMAIKERKHIAFKANGSEQIYFCTWNRFEYDVTTYGIDNNKYEGYFDGDERNASFMRNRIFPAFMFPNPGESNYNVFKKDGCQIIYMNPWSQHECLQFAEFFNLEDDCRYRFRVVGGKVRLLFSPVKDYDALLAAVHANIPEDTNEMHDQVYHVENDSFHDEMKHILYMIFRDDVLPSLSHTVFSSFVVDTMMRTRFPFLPRDEL
jgi:hypothetical protein